MPVSFLPLIAWLVLLGFLIGSAFCGRKAFSKTAIVSTLVVMLVLLVLYVPGWLLWGRAVDGDPQSQYEYVRWTENHSERINSVLFWPASTDVLGGYSWLRKAVDQE